MALQINTGFILMFVHAVTGTIMVSLQGTDISALRDTEPVNVIEGDRVLLSCSSDNDNRGTTFSWHIDDAITVNATLEIQQIRVEDAGIYVCRSTHLDLTENKTVIVQVLYPPSQPVIEGSNTGLSGEVVTLNCSSVGMPKPSYKWSHDGVVLHRNQIYQVTIPDKDYELSCVVSSLMVPTIGKSRKYSIEHKMTIQSNVMAYIKNKTGDGYIPVNEGHNFSVQCQTEGKPSPKTWWTWRKNGSTHNLHSQYLRGWNVGKEFDKDFVCHTENIVTSVTGTTIKAHDEKTFQIRVLSTTDNNKCTPELCLECCKQLPGTTHTSPSEERENINENVTVNDRNHTERVLLIVVGIGLTALILSVVLNIWLLRRMKMTKGKPSEYVQGHSAVQGTDGTQSTQGEVGDRSTEY